MWQLKSISYRNIIITIQTVLWYGVCHPFVSVGPTFIHKKKNSDLTIDFNRHIAYSL